MSLLSYLQSFPVEWIGVLSFVFCAGMILLLARVFGAMGLCAYNVIAMVAANLEALKLGQFAWFEEPVALGTVVFASSFLATDLLTEYYGEAIAKKAIWLGFSTTVLWTGLLVLMLGVKPIDHCLVHEAVATLLMPTPAIIAASLVSYLLSQQSDVFLFQGIKRLTNGRALWLRTIIATGLSTLLDTVLFSTLAWMVFAPLPISTHTLIYTYMLGTFVFRSLALVANVGIMYLARITMKKKAAHPYVSEFSL